MDRRAKPYYYLGAADVDALSDETGAAGTLPGTRDDVAKFLISILCRTGGKDSLKNIASKKHQPLTRLGIQNRDQLKTFCQAYPQCFIFHKPGAGADGGGGESVEVTPEMRMCTLHAKRAGSCPDGGECGSLHICKFFMLSGSCEFSTGKNCYCTFRHKLRSDHNQTVLKVSGGSGSSSGGSGGASVVIETVV